MKLTHCCGVAEFITLAASFEKVTSVISIGKLNIEDVASDPAGLDTGVACVWSTPITRKKGIRRIQTWIEGKNAPSLTAASLEATFALFLFGTPVTATLPLELNSALDDFPFPAKSFHARSSCSFREVARDGVVSNWKIKEKCWRTLYTTLCSFAFRCIWGFRRRLGGGYQTLVLRFERGGCAGSFLRNISSLPC